VTTILKILNKPALAKWANFLGFKRQNIDEVLNKASTIGTNIHSAIYSFMMDKYFIFIQNRHCGKHTIMRYMNSFLEWKRTHEITPIFMEKHLVTDDFGGTVDFYGIVDGKKTVIDFKTSKRVYSSMFLQLAAYCIMLEEKGHKVEQVGIIIVNEEGYNEKFITRKQLNEYIKAFKTLVSLFHVWYDLNIYDGWGDILG
jgi:CRISPR/Cas system-associated exonuclease Cas4 (RecB family)